MLDQRNASIGETLREARGTTTQQHLADRMQALGHQWSQSTVWSVEAGKRPLRLREAVDATGILGCDVNIFAPDALRIHHRTPGWIMRRYTPGDEHSWAEEFAYLDAHHAAHLARLTEDIRDNGIREPLLLGGDGRLWDGHHRLTIAHRLLHDYVPVRYAAEGDE